MRSELKEKNVVSHQPPLAFVPNALGWSSGEWSKARGRATVRPDQSQTRFLCRSRHSESEAIRRWRQCNCTARLTVTFFREQLLTKDGDIDGCWMHRSADNSESFRDRRGFCADRRHSSRCLLKTAVMKARKKVAARVGRAGAVRTAFPEAEAWSVGSVASKVSRGLGQLGPGIVTGAADDDPSGIATYSQVGAQFGFAMLWTMLFSYPLMAGIQEISAWIGRVTGIGLAGNIRRHYSVWVLYPVVALLLLANVINPGADISAMGSALKLLVGGPALFYSILFGIPSVNSRGLRSVSQVRAVA